VQDVSNPHGKFIRNLLSRQETASLFFKAVIPETNQKFLDITALEISKDQFVDDDLDHQLSDMLFRVYRTDLTPAYIYLLFQHKGNPEPLMSYLLFRYMERIWEQTISQGLIGHMPLIIPVIMYNGSKKWDVSKRFTNLFADPKDLSPFLPDFQYIMCDLSQYSEKDMPDNSILKTGMYLLKSIHDNDFQDKLPLYLNHLKHSLENDNTKKFLSYAIEYICSCTNMDEQDISSVIEELFSKTGKEIFGNVYEKLFQKGVTHQARDAIIDALTVRFEDIPSKILDILYAINEIDILKILHKQAVTSIDIDEFDEVLEMVLY